MASLFDPAQQTIPLRAPCGCGSTTGIIKTRNGQDTVWCSACGRSQRYNASRLETGRAVRSLTSRPGITPAQRARIFDAFGHACFECGKQAPEVQLTLEHILPRHLAEKYGLLDALIDSEFNLAPMCAEDNSGRAWLEDVSAATVKLIYRAVQMRALGRPEER